MNLQTKGEFISEERTDYFFMNLNYCAIALAIILLIITLLTVFRNQKKKN